MADFSGLPDEQVGFLWLQKMDEASHAAWVKTKAEEEAGQLRAELERRMGVGDAIRVEDVLIFMEPAKPNGRRSVNKDGIHAHIEVLGPMGLGPVEEVKLTYRYPSVAELDRRSHVLEAYGVPLADLVTVPPLGAPQIATKAVTEQQAAVPAAPTKEGT